MLRPVPGPCAQDGHLRTWRPPPASPLPPTERPPWYRPHAAEPFLAAFARQVAAAPQQAAAVWLDDAGQPLQSFTYAQLDAKSAAVASKLGEWNVKPGERVLLVYPPGLEFLVAFIACLRTGVTAVPVYPPNPAAPGRDLPKLRQVVEDCGATTVLTDSSYMRIVHMFYLRFVRFPGRWWHQTSAVKPTVQPSGGQQPAQEAQSATELAFLQYTSGSTGDPKGVMVSHSNLAHNTTLVSSSLRLHAASRFLSWLPQYHDLGLVVAYLCTLRFANNSLSIMLLHENTMIHLDQLHGARTRSKHESAQILSSFSIAAYTVMQLLAPSTGATGYYMSPITFIKKPALWVQLMSKYQITHTAAPNFALELCVRKFDPARDVPDGFDLSNLEMLLNAAEPIRVESLIRWNDIFSKYGWQPSAMCPSYGMAEHVVAITGWGSTMVELGTGPQHRLLHSSGVLATFPDDGRLAIVNPETCEVLGPGVEGEIWVSSENVTLGYWNKPELTKEASQLMFRAQLKEGSPDSDDRDYLRTGDLGFLIDTQLFVTGRIKDLIIVRGKNYYPQDIEKTAEDASPHIRAGCVAAFSFAAPAATAKCTDLTEQVAIVAEVRSATIRGPDLVEMTREIRRQVTVAHGVYPAIVALIPPRSISKTTSGKIKRRMTMEKLTQGSLKILNKSCSTDAKGAAEEVQQMVDVNTWAGVDEKSAEQELDMGGTFENNTETDIDGSHATTADKAAQSGAVNTSSCQPIADPDNNAKIPAARESCLEGKSIEEAAMILMEVQEARVHEPSSIYSVYDFHEQGGVNVKDDDSLISLGLTSISAVEIIDLVNQRTGQDLLPDDIQARNTRVDVTF
eukprot:SM000182S03947  [mRNA]  locus=s182:103437:108614:- [translate_table: standard]